MPDPDYFVPELSFARMFLHQLSQGDLTKHEKLLDMDLRDALDAWYLKRIENLNTRISYLESAPDH